MTPFIFFYYFYWHYGSGLKGLVLIWRNFILFAYHFFSIGLLIKTLFSPWHRILTPYGRGFDPGRYLRILAENLISRILGAIVRTFVILMGLFAEIIILSVGLTAVILWVVIPIISIILIAWAISLIIPK